MLAKEYLPRYTVEDYRLWEGDWELIEGVPFAMAPSPTGKHQGVLVNLIFSLKSALKEYSERKALVYAELDWVVSEDTVVRPDASVLCREVSDYIKSPPEAVFEVVSKSTALKDEKLKFELYRREGVKYYLLVYPEVGKVRGFRLEGDKYEKFFDSDEGLLELSLCGCKVELEVKELFTL